MLPATAVTRINRSLDRVMQVYGPQGVRLGAAAPAARRSVGSGFALAEEESPSPAKAGAPRSIGGIDALLALQGVEDAPERRRRAVRKGRQTLDALDEIKLAVLTGKLSPAALTRLRSLAGELRADSGDPALDGVLGEIALRAEVELAKASRG